MNSLKKPKVTIWKLLTQMRLTVILGSLIGFVAFASFIGIEVTSQSGFCDSCHIMNDYYASWERSTHNEVECLKCHLQPGFTNYMVGKINGLAQTVDCLVGRVGTKAEATVFDVSCLRSECHSVDKLLDEDIVFGNVKFTHKGHIQTAEPVTITPMEKNIFLWTTKSATRVILSKAMRQVPAWFKINV